MKFAAILIFAIIYLAVFALMFISMWKIFEKAGKPGWASLVPFYNLYVMTEITRKPTWWFGMMFVPLANAMFAIMLVNAMSKAFGKDEGYTLGLLFLPYVFYPILAFGEARYIHAEDTGNPDLLDA